MDSHARLALVVSRACGKPLTFWSAVVGVIIWAATGPWFHWSDTWQLLINTPTTVITFLMVFLIQASQERAEAAQAKTDAALHAKLDEIIRSTAASNAFIGLDDQELEVIEEYRRKTGRLRTS